MTTKPELNAQKILDTEDINLIAQRIALQIAEKHRLAPLALVGIHTRGIPFAERVASHLRPLNPKLTMGRIDITLYRDDLDNLDAIPSVRSSELPFPVQGARIIIFDDVLFTGRTIRAALNVLMDYGRPSRVELAVLIDRMQRELPIGPDYIGRQIPCENSESISVRFRESDNEDGVYILGRGAKS